MHKPKPNANAANATAKIWNQCAVITFLPPFTSLWYALEKLLDCCVQGFGYADCRLYSLVFAFCFKFPITSISYPGFLGDLRLRLAGRFARRLKLHSHLSSFLIRNFTSCNEFIIQEL
nr:MAG TPA: hypothetical protein [Caudoviricetes sp.]